MDASNIIKFPVPMQRSGVSTIIQEPDQSNTVWECECGCQLFYIVPAGMECSECSAVQEYEQ